MDLTGWKRKIVVICCNCTFQRTNLTTNNHPQIIRFWDGAPVPQTGRGVVRGRRSQAAKNIMKGVVPNPRRCKIVGKSNAISSQLPHWCRPCDFPMCLFNGFQCCVSMLGGVRKGWSSQPYWPCKVPNRWLKLPDLDDDRWSEGCCQPNKNLQFPHRMAFLRESLVRSLAPKGVPDFNAGTPWAL